MREYFLERLDLGGKQKSDKSEPGTETVQDQVVHIKNPDDEAELHDFDRQRDRQPNGECHPTFMAVGSEH